MWNGFCRSDCICQFCLLYMTSPAIKIREHQMMLTSTDGRFRPEKRSGFLSRLMVPLQGSLMHSFENVISFCEFEGGGLGGTSSWMRNLLNDTDHSSDDLFHKIPEHQSTRSCESTLCSSTGKIPCVLCLFLCSSPYFWPQFKTVSWV